MGNLKTIINYSDISRWCKLIRFYNKRSNSEQIETNLKKIEMELDNGIQRNIKASRNRISD